MLIRFTAENFLSISERVEFSMLANPNDPNFTNHIVPATSPTQPSLLRAAILYGANASGKSNLIKAMAFAQQLIIRGISDNNISFNNADNFYFKLDKKQINQPTRFEFEIMHREKQYAYGIIFNKKSIIEEWLVDISGDTEVKIFERLSHQKTIRLNLDYPTLAPLSDHDKNRLQYEAEGSRKNLFLHTINQADKGIDYFSDVFDWFENHLTIIFPYTRANLPLRMQQDSTYQQRLNELIKEFGLGIDEVALQEKSVEDVKKLPNSLMKLIRRNLEENNAMFIELGHNMNIISIINNELILLELITRRQTPNGMVDFDFAEESDGTKRLFDFLPLMLKFAEGGQVFVIDEVERRLHALLSKRIFDVILNQNNTPSQIIATTHETQLMDVKHLLRKDEIWLVEKKPSGASEYYSLAGTDLSGLDLIKGYLKGRYGAIPIFQDHAVHTEDE